MQQWEWKWCVNNGEYRFTEVGVVNDQFPVISAFDEARPRSIVDVVIEGLLVGRMVDIGSSWERPNDSPRSTVDQINSSIKASNECSSSSSRFPVKTKSQLAVTQQNRHQQQQQQIMFQKWKRELTAVEESRRRVLRRGGARVGIAKRIGRSCSWWWWWRRREGLAMAAEELKRETSSDDDWNVWILGNSWMFGSSNENPRLIVIADPLLLFSPFRVKRRIRCRTMFRVFEFFNTWFDHVGIVKLPYP